MHKHIENEVTKTFPAEFEIEHGFVDPDQIAAGKSLFINLLLELNTKQLN